jgi:uncharacterized protein DUF4242
MPRYLITRDFSVTENEMPEVGRRSKRIAIDEFPQIIWEHSHVLVNDDGTVTTHCVYDAPDEETVRRHAIALGQHDYVIREIAGDVSPADFPLEGELAA